jgi:hypothetical protein
MLHEPYRMHGGAAMHLDEYEISLARELKICESAIQKATKYFASMKKKYGLETASFIEKYNSGALGASREFNSWAEKYKGLQKWEERRNQYKELLRAMKI